VTITTNILNVTKHTESHLITKTHNIMTFAKLRVRSSDLFDLRTLNLTQLLFMFASGI